MSVTGGGGRRRAADVVGVLAVLLAVIGAIALVVGLRAQHPAPPQVPAAVDASSPTPGSTAGGPAGTADRTADKHGPSHPAGPAGTQHAAQPGVQELGYSPPVNLRIPAIGVDSRLVDLGLDETGAMETPEPVEIAGWFAPSPPPGVPGSTILVGHVTWNQVPTVFFRLADLRPGDRVDVRRADGVRTVFEVTRLGTFPKDGFPTAQVFDHPRRSELRLITCGGRYDATNHRYLSNVIVWARIVDVVGA
jgi:sortase (surface protein transpeptidase)